MVYTSLKYFVNDCLWKQFFASNSPQTPSNLISLTILVTVRPFTQFILKLEQLSRKKVLKFSLLGNCFSDLFTEVEISYEDFQVCFGTVFNK